MPDKITNLDIRLANEDWHKEMAQNLANIRREPVNTDPYSQAHLMNAFFRRYPSVENDG